MATGNLRIVRSGNYCTLQVTFQYYYMIKRFIYLIVLTGVMNVAMAQNKEEAAVTAAVENLRKAMIDGDKAGLQNITADQLSYGHSSGKVEDKATFVDNIV